MKFFTNVALLFYVATISLMSSLVILFVSHSFVLEDVYHYLSIIYEDLQSRMMVGAVGCFLIFLSFLFARIISGARQKERAIAFDNPSGRVTVSLAAVEDLVKRLVYRLSEIKEVRSHIIATKKGIEVESRLVLRADVNIPELTARLQELIKNKIQEILGVEEAIIVRIHVVKIASEEVRSKRDSKEEVLEKPAVPYSGYRI